jgi:hypothetical protein
MKPVRSVAACALAVWTLTAAEGKWTPNQVVQLDRAWLKQQGLQLAPERLWDPVRGTGLLTATVSVPGCTASFISNTGLIATNFHCVISFLQEHSKPGGDLTTHGFLARSRDRELPSKTFRASIPYRFTDVTREVEAAIPAGADDLARMKAIEARQKDLVAACEKRKFARCRVATFDGGLKYVLVDTTELPDIRLVYAPPRAIGEYGGDADNFMWPRHTGDFAIARAYVAPDGSPAAYSTDNVPYNPQYYFPISQSGVRPGDFVMVIGYPGATYRSMTAAEMAHRRESFYPQRIDLYGEYISTMQETAKNDLAGRIAITARLSTWANNRKNAQGQIAALDRGRILDKQRAAEKEVVEWASARPAFAGALAARQEIVRLVEDQKRTVDRDVLLNGIGPIALNHATIIVRAANERQKPDADREPAYMERELPRLRQTLDRQQASYFNPTDRALLSAWARRALALPDGQRIEAAATILDRVDSIYAGTKIASRDERLKMLSETPAELGARKDPMLDLAFALEPDLLELKQRTDRQSGATARLTPQWRRAVLAHAGKPVAPDANGTLRVSFAHVKGYRPRDGVLYEPQTTLLGLLEKHTGEEPFNAPSELRAAAEGSASVPVNFLADADTTGGNSGSPVVNGKGELVGLNFDRVWENIANDFGYNPDVARNVNVDTRYMLWVLDKVSSARELIDELKPRP